MPDKWMTLAAAAATLDVHPRTIERRIASGKIESRRTDDGQLQVLISAPDDAPGNAEAFETVKELAQDQVSLATGSASALVKFAQADAERARGELDLVRQDAGRARQSAKTAWVAVAAMSLAICVAVGWTTFKLTRGTDDLRALGQQIDNAKREAAQMRNERDTARRDAQDARLAEATKAGHLEAISSKSDKGPATRPANFIQRLAAAFIEP